MSDGPRYRRSPHVLHRSFADQVLLALPGRDDMVVLRGNARSAWGCLDGSVTAQELADRLARRVGGTPQTIRADVTRVLCVLEDGGWIEQIR